MDGNGVLTDRQLRVIPFLLAASSIEEGYRRARISATSRFDAGADIHSGIP